VKIGVRSTAEKNAPSDLMNSDAPVRFLPTWHDDVNV
jgi:hypothetical protein